MKGRSKPWLVDKQKCLVLKMLVMFLTTVVTVCLFLNHSNVVKPSTSTAIDQLSPSIVHHVETVIDTVTEPVTVAFDDQEPPSGKVDGEECDLFTGEWIPNPSGPVYSNDSCNFIEEHQNCMTNGRPDLGYLYWKWKPRNCELPILDALRFLNMMRNKTWAFIGDSITRNHVQSLLCTLSKVEEPVSTYHDEKYRSRGWNFRSYNLTICVFWSPFLVEATLYEDSTGGFSDREIELHLDKLDKRWTKVFKNFDYIVFATGKWFLRAAVYFENNKLIGCHSCPNWNSLTELGFDFAYRKALRNTLDFIVNSGHKGVIFFRTCTPNHFEGGQWYEGGGCNRTVPFKEGEFDTSGLHNILRKVEVDEYENAVKKANQNGVQLKLLDLMQLSMLRPDGHPGPYRSFKPFAKDKNAKVINDCLHWCLPGPIDTWNDVIMKMLPNE